MMLIFRFVRFCWKSLHWVFWWCWIHFWCYFDPQKLSFGGILMPQNVKKRPMIFSRCLILLKFCPKLLWILTLSGEPIILCLVGIEVVLIVLILSGEPINVSCWSLGFNRWGLWFRLVRPSIRASVRHTLYLENRTLDFDDFLHKW